MKRYSKRLMELSKIIETQENFTRFNDIQKLSDGAKDTLFLNLGVTNRLQRGVGMKEVIKILEAIPDNQWIQYVNQAQAREIVDEVRMRGGQEGVRKLLVLLEDYEDQKIDKEEFKQQFQILNG